MLAERASRNLKGKAKPRLAPPTPARSGVKEFAELSASIGIELMPWQKTTAQYLTALGRGERWLYPEVATVVARQNGKTTLLVPLILSRLLKGHHIMHTAQTRELPREVFGMVVDVVWQHYRGMLRRKPRFANGQEEIRFTNGAIYRIVAPSRGGARGPANDLVIIDELREFKEHDFMAAAKPTLMASSNPQMVYLSNAGEDDSVVLNSIRQRADSDPNLAYLEWSAAPERDTSDRAGWYESNPAIGHMPDRDMLGNLEKDYQAHRLAGTMAIFEVENLCRWVTTTREPLVEHAAWTAAQAELGTPRSPQMAVSMDPEGRRASVAIAWQLPDGSTALRILFNVTGDPIDTDKLGKDIRLTANRLGAVTTGFDPLTDAELAKYLTKTKPVTGREFAAGTSQFVSLVTGGKLRWQDAEAVTDDLTWTARKYDTTDKGSFEAVRSKDDRPITASLAAIRAVWLASGPKPASPRVL